eukprot:175450-Prymnesium_polylepis.1
MSSTERSAVLSAIVGYSTPPSRVQVGRLEDACRVAARWWFAMARLAWAQRRAIDVVGEESPHGGAF